MKRLYSASDHKRLAPLPPGEKKPEPWRSAFRRDYGRLVHCPAFRRLQGKKQLFPGVDSDFFRNRLTHSLEVAQIATSIALKLNETHPYFQRHPIDVDIVATAALAHDLGHPPFGHNGEEALDECMRESGGFEGNAQTLRILTRLEKRQTMTVGANSSAIPILNGMENRAGLNLTIRTLAAILKYDKKIPLKRPLKDSVCKGYYLSEEKIVAEIKKAIPSPPGNFRTVECCIMDIADDIAYSTYDLEDAFKANFLTPVRLVAQPQAVTKNVADEVKKRLERYYSHLPKSQRVFTSNDVIQTLAEEFRDFYSDSTALVDEPGDLNAFGTAFYATDQAYAASAQVVTNGYTRVRVTSDLVGKFIEGVEVEENEKYPAHTRVRLNVRTFKTVEVLKNFTFQSLIMSPRLKVSEHRGKQIVKDIFAALNDKHGHMLMPDDARAVYEEIKGNANKRRVICDFIASMTDRYALQFYSRLYGTNHESIYAPL